ncbi:MAG: DPP IV N-terminal domain-containing protein [bacterium]
MNNRRMVSVACWIYFTLLFSFAAFSQGTLKDYQRANGLRNQVRNLAYHSLDRATWIDSTHQFWYSRSVKGGKEFMLVDADKRTTNPAFDHTKLAASLSKASGDSCKALELPFSSITFVDKGGAVEFEFKENKWRCSLESYECKKIGPSTTRRPPEWREEPRLPKNEAVFTPSPDNAWEAFIRNYNVFLRTKDTLKKEFQLSYEGSEGEFYGPPFHWSPDSKKLMVWKTKPGYERRVQYVESSPKDQLQPKYSSRIYTKPGDVLPVDTPVLFNIEARKQTIVGNELFPNPYYNGDLKWWKDSRAFTFAYNQRGHQSYRIVEVDAQTGAARALINEEPKTFFDYSGKRYRYDVNDGVEIIWMSERDGWNHLYLYDGKTGKVKNQVTKGEWVVRGVERVDEEKRQIIFRASGMDVGVDPYLIHYYRINFDGSNLRHLSEGNGNHTASFSKSMEYFVDTYSRVDQSPVSVLRRSSDGSILFELEKSDISDLVKSGWRIPEVFSAKGRDGVTDIWGMICRPTNFNPSKKYPVIENIYAGPHSSHVPKSFSSYNAMQSLAELGFIVVQIDGMGTSNRSKAFHDVCWKNLADAGFSDRILWHKAAAKKYPWYDISRVGIYGTSAGGQNSMGALLFHPEFYKAAVSACGCHDNRMDKIWWNELWMSWPIGPHYAAASNVDNAYRLQGKLLLIVGELDTNVDPSSTMQVVNALIKAKKEFELLVVPGMGHSNGGEYGDRRRNDFFVRTLLGVEPPNWNITELKTQ